MKYTVDKHDIYTVLRIDEPQINSLNAPQLKSELVFFHNEGVEHMVLDMEQIEYVDSSGLSAILTGHRLWRDGGLFVLCNANHAAVQRLIEISKLDKILIIIPTLDEAIDYVMMEQLEKDFASEEEE
ncbi:STAS domain-containing protein [Membranicola marinus]|uniref:Anti-sigma factor antagonist n=1 Tax=Membranihabitans marinus TaxID=1227546 RepID=A0A953LC71_9BACT|nr:STAS domain-containing protein [Membranihabitans marinus]MBY5959231.1 STAS domain-containing protein [Membranihabitans marinus]